MRSETKMKTTKDNHMLHLQTGCNYCKHLKCVDESKDLLRNFVCSADETKSIRNAGACFVEIIKDVSGKEGAIIIQDCRDFVEC